MAEDTSIDLPAVIADGRWLAHRYDDAADTVHFRFVERAQHRATTFLSDVEVGDGPRFVASREACFSAASALGLPAPRLIAHSAYCCSTMLVKAFDVEGTSMGLSEPLILNDIVGLRLRGGDPRQIAAALDIALLLLSRPLAAGETNVVKASNIVNPLLPLVMRLRPDVRTLLMHAPLEAFVASIARKEIEGRTWARELMWKYIRMGQLASFGFTEEDLYRQTDLQAAAVGWLAQHALFAALAGDFPSQVRTLNSETMLSAPEPILAAVAGHLGIAIDATAVAHGPAFARHSKSGDTFGAEARALERKAGLERHGREIGLVADWAGVLSASHGIPDQLPGGLDA